MEVITRIMKTYRITFSDSSTIEVRAISIERAMYEALSYSHLHIIKVEEVK